MINSTCVRCMWGSCKYCAGFAVLHFHVCLFVASTLPWSYGTKLQSCVLQSCHLLRGIVHVFRFLVCVRSGGVSGCMAEAAWRAARRVPTRSPDAPTLRADDEPGVSQLKQVLQQKHQKYLGFCPCLRLSVSASYFHMPRVLTIGFFSSAFSGCPNHPL